jgi:hypothetical protein
MAELALQLRDALLPLPRLDQLGLQGLGGAGDARFQGLRQIVLGRVHLGAPLRQALGLFGQ